VTRVPCAATIATSRVALRRVDIKMKFAGLGFSVFVSVAACALSGCASTPSATQVAGPDVKIYQSNNLTSSRYDVVRRVWVESWRSAFWLPTYPTEAEGIESLQTEAGRAGADGLINVICIDQGPSKWSSNQESRIVCYGNAIRMRPSQG
jgi:hypothetical protein